MRTMRATITNVGGITKTYKRVERTLRVFDDGDDGDDGAEIARRRDSDAFTRDVDVLIMRDVTCRETRYNAILTHTTCCM